LSLVTTPQSSLSRCAACGSDRVTAITMTLTDGSEVDFTSCHRCEHRTWVQGDDALALDSVLTKATKRR
jgi:DNA-directed RNA polymerase subunit M/transcription elongation factor TFIIS